MYQARSIRDEKNKQNNPDNIIAVIAAAIRGSKCKGGFF